MRTIKTRKFILRNIYSGIDLQIAEVGENYHTTCYTYHLEDFFNELKNTPQAECVELINCPSLVEVDYEDK